MLNGAPHPSFARRRRPRRSRRARALNRRTRPYVLSLGTLEPRKNLPMLLQASRKIALLARDRDPPAPPRPGDGGGGRGWREFATSRRAGAPLPTGPRVTRSLRPRGGPGRALTANCGATVLRTRSPFEVESSVLPALEGDVLRNACRGLRTSRLCARSARSRATLVPPSTRPLWRPACAALVEDKALTQAARARGAGSDRPHRRSACPKTAATLWDFGARHAQVARLRSLIACSRRRRAVLCGLYWPAPPLAVRPRETWRSLSHRRLLFVLSLLREPAVVPSTIARAPAWSCGSSPTRCAGALCVCAAVVLIPSIVQHRRVGDSAGREHLFARREEGAASPAELLRRHDRVLSSLRRLPFSACWRCRAHRSPRTRAGATDIDLRGGFRRGAPIRRPIRRFPGQPADQDAAAWSCAPYLVDEDPFRSRTTTHAFGPWRIRPISMVRSRGWDLFVRFVKSPTSMDPQAVPYHTPVYESRGRGGGRWGCLAAGRESSRGVWFGCERPEHLLARRLGACTSGGGPAPSRPDWCSAAVSQAPPVHHRRRVLDRFEQKLQGLRRRLGGPLRSRPAPRPSLRLRHYSL